MRPYLTGRSVGRKVLRDPPETRRRLRALRALTPPTETERANRTGRGDRDAGISVRELAERLKGAGVNRGLGYDTLSDIERGERQLYQQEARTIAEICNIPVEFFTFELSNLSARGTLEARMDDMATQIDAIQSVLGALTDDPAPEVQSDETSGPRKTSENPGGAD